MKTNHLLLVVLLGLATRSPGQGPLAPPAGSDPSIGPTNALNGAGRPQPSMKTLHQVEPRIPVQSLGAAPPYTITQPGSYYLTGNITVGSGNAINVYTSNVSLDLMGFTLESTQSVASGTAIAAGTVSRLCVCNGNIQSGSTVNSGALTARGFVHGINGTAITESTVSDVQVTGVAMYGIALVGNSLVERCRVSNANFGIYNAAGSSITRSCVAANCATSGVVGAIVEGCYGYGFWTAGISATVASDSQGFTQTGSGMVVTYSAQNCSGNSGVGTGIDGTGATVSGCNALTVGGGYSLIAKIAIGCVVSGGSPNITNRYNMP